MGFPNMDFSEADAFCKKNGIELYHEPSDVYEILKLNKTDDGRLQCSLCSKFKKALVIDGAKKYRCNKVAFAHHGDDAVETLFMNMISVSYTHLFNCHIISFTTTASKNNFIFFNFEGLTN